MLYFLLPLLVAGTYNTILPVFIENDAARIKLQPVFSNGTVGWNNWCPLNMTSAISTIQTSTREQGRGFLLYGGDGTYYVAMYNTAGYPILTRDESALGISPQSDIYIQYENGVMFLPGRWGSDFPNNTEISMVLNPRFAENFCEQGSLFYVDLLTNTFEVAVQTDVVPVGENPGINQQSDNEADSPIEMYAFTASEYLDVFTDHVIEKLKRYLNIPSSSSGLPYFVENCEMNRYPSIHFKIGQLDAQSHFNHIGTIIYGPEDYLEFILDTECSFKIGRSGSPKFGLNFLSSIATHLNNNRIGFCDPIY
jgi:hypothetical protein